MSEHRRYTEAEYAESMKPIPRDIPNIGDCSSLTEFMSKVHRVATDRRITGIAIVFVTDKGLSTNEFGLNTNDLMGAGIALCKWAEDDADSIN